MKGGSAAAFLFDLDGTLVDSVYQHVIAWQEAFSKDRLFVEAWKIHRRIGMSGELFLNAVMRDMGHKITKERAKHFEHLHKNAYGRLLSGIKSFPGSKELLRHLTRSKIPWAIGTSGGNEATRRATKSLGLSKSATVITGDMVENTKPCPDLFMTASQKLGVEIQDSIIVGDSVWDILAARRAGALAVGLLSGGISPEDLANAGAFRIYRNPAHLLQHLDEIGVSVLS